MKRSRTSLGWILLLAALFAAGCVSNSWDSTTDADGREVPGVYPMTALQADGVLRDAFAAEFPDKELRAIDHPHDGYDVTVWWAIDHDHVHGTMVPAQGRKQDGTQVPGFVFEVGHSGTAPAAGVPHAQRLKRKIEELAREIARPLPLAADAG